MRESEKERKREREKERKREREKKNDETRLENKRRMLAHKKGDEM